MNGPAKDNTKPAVPSTGKPGEVPDPFGDSADAKPAVKPPLGADVPAPDRTVRRRPSLLPIRSTRRQPLLP